MLPAPADLGLDGAQARELAHLGDLRADLLARGVADDKDVVAEPGFAAEDLADRDPSHVVAPVDVGDEHVEGLVRLRERGRDVVEDGLEEGGHVLPLVAELVHHVPVAAGAEDDRRVELLLGGVELQQELLDLVVHLLRLGVLAVDLVDHDHDLKAVGERLAQHEAGLGLGPVVGVHEEKHPVDHPERPLDLAAEVRVPGRVDDVDRLVVPVDRGVLGLDRDALLLLEVHGVHGALLDLLVGAVHPAFLEELVDQRGLAVVNVGYDGDIADVLVHGAQRA